MSANLQQINPERILIIRLGGIRDGLMTIPLAVDAKKLWPDVKISWALDGELAQILESHQSIDQVIQIEPHWMRRPACWRKLVENLREPRFDITFDPQGITKSAMLGMLTCCKNRIGFDRQHSRELATWFFTHRIKSNFLHRVDRYRDLLSPWHSTTCHATTCYSETLTKKAEFCLPSCAEASQRVSQLAGELTTNSRHWFTIYPGAIWPTAVWPLERFAAVAKNARENFDLTSLIVWRNEHEHLIAKVIAEQSQGAAQVAPALSLPELIETCRQTHFVLCADSDMLQIASATYAPCISLHGTTWADEYGSHRFGNFAIQSPHPIDTKRTMRRGSNNAMLKIEVEEVMYHIHRLLRQRSANDAASSAAA